MRLRKDGFENEATRDCEATTWDLGIREYGGKIWQTVERASLNRVLVFAASASRESDSLGGPAEHAIEQHLFPEA
ncbi:hypothetical protein NA56DRAFT_699671 [Hyaloscypha hepaticicola]|uniref:Uncharacterized protein n=1 Tax=Hyaloscypha hepaticicola TaxID=2082293 RepID=A0A2J6QF28_9HELO|nr:hypothetical protein NA56DRAFT_699671 [Hyaloscypha hepaticicola]